jgi:hypothetical protein
VFESCLGETFFAPVQTGPRLPQNPVKCVPVHLSWSKAAGSCCSERPRRLEPRLKKVQGCRSIHLLSPSAFISFYRVTFTFLYSSRSMIATLLRKILLLTEQLRGLVDRVSDY